MAFAADASIDLDQTTADRAHPNFSGAIVGECDHLRTAKRSAGIMTQQPTTRIPVTRAAAGAHPQNPAAILVQRHYTVVAQTLRIVHVVPIAHEGLGAAIEKVQPVRRCNPKALGVVLDDRPD